MSDKPKDADLERARARARASLPVTLMAFLAVIAMTMPLPKRFVTLLPLVLTIVLAVRYLRQLGDVRRRERVMPILTIVVMALIGGLLALQVAFYPTVKKYEDCIRGAQTKTARADCTDLVDLSPMGTKLFGAS